MLGVIARELTGLFVEDGIAANGRGTRNFCISNARHTIGDGWHSAAGLPRSAFCKRGKSWSTLIASVVKRTSDIANVVQERGK
jgi:hypothetical protein